MNLKLLYYKIKEKVMRWKNRNKIQFLPHCAKNMTVTLDSVEAFVYNMFHSQCFVVPIELASSRNLEAKWRWLSSEMM